jgi:hypothetical protein
LAILQALDPNVESIAHARPNQESISTPTSAGTEHRPFQVDHFDRVAAIAAGPKQT